MRCGTRSSPLESGRTLAQERLTYVAVVYAVTLGSLAF